jgi:hypothetical protein
LVGRPNVTALNHHHRRAPPLTTLRIEHPITDYDVWRKAFDRFGQARSEAGVSGFSIHRPVDDPRYLMIDLELPTIGAAREFAAFLTRTVWSNPDASPGLAGVPLTRVLETMPLQAAD